MRGETTLAELRRQYHCAAYNLMVAFISRTQTEVKFYTAFLFEEKENKARDKREKIVCLDTKWPLTTFENVVGVILKKVKFCQYLKKEV